MKKMYEKQNKNKNNKQQSISGNKSFMRNKSNDMKLKMYVHDTSKPCRRTAVDPLYSRRILFFGTISFSLSPLELRCISDTYPMHTTTANRWYDFAFALLSKHSRDLD